MTAKQLYNTCCDCSADGHVRFNQADDALQSYIKCHCYHPLKIKTFDSYLGTFVERQVPCGKCYHCVETKINSWVSRMYAHLEDFKYCYFVTLTYRSFTPAQIQHPYHAYIYNYLFDAAWHLDSYNFNKKLCYTPCLLVKSHYQDFLKRLRKNTGIKDITYFGCGEYGSKFSHPHFHFIIFSHEPISALHFQRAWGLVLGRSGSEVLPGKNCTHKHFMSFGRIQVDDLVTNGTISTKKVAVDGQMYDAKKCFAYVCKYIGKRTNNKRRLSLIYNLLNNGKFYETKNDSLPYSNFDEFVQAFRPFVCCSRGTPIGSLYLKRHIKEMASGVFAPPPLLEAKSYVVPDYFRRKAAEYLFSLRTLSPSGNFSKGNVCHLAKSLAHYVSSELSRDITSLAYKHGEAVSFLPTYSPDKIKSSLDFLLSSEGTFVDVLSRSRFLIEFDGFHFESLCVIEYKYSRSERCWTPVCYHSLEDWCLHYLTCIPNDYNRYIRGYNLTKENEKYFALAREWYDLHDKSERFLGMVDSVEADNAAFFNVKDTTFLNRANL